VGVGCDNAVVRPPGEQRYVVKPGLRQAGGVLLGSSFRAADERQRMYVARSLDKEDVVFAVSG